MPGKKSKEGRHGITKVEAIRPTPEVPKRWPIPTIRILAMLGLGIGAYLSFLHYQAGTGGSIESPFCGVGTVVNCNAVLGSQYARLFGLPVATWAALTYAAILFASFRNPKGLLVFLCGWTFAFSVYMAGLSVFTLRSACLFCMSLYAINTVLMIAAMTLTRRFSTFTSQQVMYSAASYLILVIALGWLQSATAAPGRSAGSDAEFIRQYNIRPIVTVQTPERHTKGPAQAAVTISEFVDFR